MYQFSTTERNNETASEYETKAMLYLFGYRRYSRDMDVLLVTLFLNYISDIEFKHYILFMPKLKEMYLNDEDMTYFQIDNFKLQYIDKIRQGLKFDCCIKGEYAF